MRCRKGAIVLAAALAVCGPVALDALAQAFTLGGTWQGRYFYNDNKQSVDFVLRLDVDGGRCLGRIEEPNTFGDKAESHLYANVACVSLGVQPGREFRFIKQYDGTGKVAHFVEYAGVVSADGNTVTGHWRIRQDTGQFSMTRSRFR
jgi:hypothetical protein